jgi:CelD/BcsL family acetyltransferase involved in cellulose biosynthesis
MLARMTNPAMRVEPRRKQTLAPRPLPQGEGPAFASVDVHADLESAAADWAALAPGAGAYQSFAFARAWAQTVGQGVRLAIVVARDRDGRPAALLALRRRRLGPLDVARFLGGSWANYHMGLFRPGLEWRREDVRALLSQAGRQAGIGLFCFAHQPAAWEDRDNPLALLPGRRSPNTAYATKLGGVHAEWVDAHFSRSTQKKLRKKARKLEPFGPLRAVRAADAAEAVRFLDAFFAHKAAQAASRGEPDVYGRRLVCELMRALIAEGAMEMHALLAGERIVASFGALPAGARLSGLVLSYDSSPETAAASPGEWLLIEVARDAIARGFATLDLGVGASRYKGEICEIEEILTDAAFGVSKLGRLVAPLYHLWRGAKGLIKRHEGLRRRVERVRQALTS